MLIAAAPSNGHHLTLEDIRENVVISDDVHACPTKVISLENTLNRNESCPSKRYARSQPFAKEHDIKMHLDGARIWEVAAADAGTLPEFTTCFDSVSLCFSKGLGAPIGSIIVGSTPFIKRARHVRKAIGGGTRQAGVISAACQSCSRRRLRQRVPEARVGSCEPATSVQNVVEKIWQEKGGRLSHPVETNMVLAGSGRSSGQRVGGDCQGGRRQIVGRPPCRALSDHR